jgi:hypothetical protein
MVLFLPKPVGRSIQHGSFRKEVLMTEDIAKTGNQPDGWDGSSHFEVKARVVVEGGNYHYFSPSAFKYKMAAAVIKAIESANKNQIAYVHVDDIKVR